MTARKLRLGVAGLGRAFMLMLPTLAQHPRLNLTAAADPRGPARAAFAHDFGGRAYSTVEELCADPDIQAVYIASPHEHHAAHAALAARHGKHILIEKPMALTLEECDAMIATAKEAGVYLIVGHCHSFDRPYQRTRELIGSGAFGRVRMIQALDYTDFLYRPRRPEELDTEQGGGTIFSQAPHQIDIARLLAGSPVTSVRAAAGRWDPARPTEGAYTAFVTFADGAAASLTYSGYGHFDSDEFMGWIGEMGERRDPQSYGGARAKLRNARNAGDETAMKDARAYGTMRMVPEELAETYNHFGFFLVSCDKADLRPMPDGVWIYGDDEKRFEALPPPQTPRGEVIDELYRAVMQDKPPLHDGAWGRATMEACLALLQSAREGREIAL